MLCKCLLWFTNQSRCMARYNPKPIDTSSIELGPELSNLAEKLAKNTHEVWAQNRINLGWTHGAVRDDQLKTHPSLIEYEALSEEEKDFDRSTSSETLKLIKQLGFVITPPSGLTATSQTDDSEVALTALLRSESLTLNELIAIWHQHDKALWSKVPALYATLGERFLKRGEPLLAYDVFDEGLSVAADNPKGTDNAVKSNLVHKKALALAETGALVEATALLETLDEGCNSRNPEILALLGRIHKQRGLQSGQAELKANQLRLAKQYYLKGYELGLANKDDDAAYYNGINAATMAFFLHDSDEKDQLTERVKSICLNKLSECTGEAQSKWLWATLGEVNLLAGDIEQATHWYRKALIAFKNDARARVSMYKQANAILLAGKLDNTWLQPLFDLPRVVTFQVNTNQEPQRKPLHMQLSHTLGDCKNTIAYATAASLIHLEFLDYVFQDGGEINLIVPYRPDVWRQQLDNPKAVELFDELLTKASRVVVLTEQVENNQTVVMDFVEKFTLGVTLLRASNLTVSAYELKLKDNTDSNTPPYELKCLEAATLGHETKGLFTPRAIEQKSLGASSYSYLPMLFADIKGYSKLNESQLVTFATQFLGIINQAFVSHHQGILKSSTQGDGMFVVFADLCTAMRFASDLKHLVGSTHWPDYGLPDTLSIRISLDAGPCHAFTEPITNQREFCGSYVNRAARIEPITPPGHIYASETFTALSKLLNDDEFKFVYTGQVVLPKNSGVIAAYHLYRATD